MQCVHTWVTMTVHMTTLQDKSKSCLQARSKYIYSHHSQHHPLASFSRNTVANGEKHVTMFNHIVQWGLSISNICTPIISSISWIAGTHCSYRTAHHHKKLRIFLWTFLFQAYLTQCSNAISHKISFLCCVVSHGQITQQYKYGNVSN